MSWNISWSPLKFLFSVAAVFAWQPASANSYAREYLEFKNICSVVEFQAEPQLEGLFSRDSINKSVADAIDGQLRDKGFSFPIEYGRQCYPGKVGSAPKQLSIQFHVSLAQLPGQGHSVFVALIAHTYYDNILNGPHNYATAIRLCADLLTLSTCIKANIVRYFDDTILQAIVRAQAILKEQSK